MKILDKLFKKNIEVVPEKEEKQIFQRFYGGRIHKQSYYTRNL